jgi:DUF4097 and DUF4098 domain-containing protein YvlB
MRRRNRAIAATAIAIAAALGTWAPAAAQGPPASGAPQTDQTVEVKKGARLTVDAFAGDVVVRGWAQDRVRVRARHGSRTRVAVRTAGSVVSVRASSDRGPAGPVDYEIHVPAWMPVKVDGTYAFITVEGTDSEVAAETVRGDIRVAGGSGAVSGKSIEGEVHVERTRGRVAVSSVNDAVSVTETSGDVLAETTNGRVALRNIESRNVEATTVNGNITYEGSAAPGGSYRLSTHNGSIIVAVPETAGAAFAVRTYRGAMRTNLPLSGSGDVSRGRRVTFTLGDGGAAFELESFGGTIRLLKPGSLPETADTKDKRKSPTPTP